MRAPRGAAQAFIDRAVAYAGLTCLPWPYSVSRDGYGQFNGRHAHTVVLERVLPRPSLDLVAAHEPIVCHNRLCVNPAHLRWATRSENTADRHIDGTMTRGEEHYTAKLTEVQAQAVIDDDRPPAALAAALGVSYHCVYDIKTGRRWPHLQRKAS